MNEMERFMEIWDREAAKTAKLLAALPEDQYDFRPDPDGRSLGELAWHLAEPEGHGPFAIGRGGFSRDARPSGLERPRVVRELAPAFERVHAEALERVKKLTIEDLDRSIPFFNGQPISVRNVLWGFCASSRDPPSRPTVDDGQASGRAAGLTLWTDARNGAAQTARH